MIWQGISVSQLIADEVEWSEAVTRWNELIDSLPDASGSFTGYWEGSAEFE